MPRTAPVLDRGIVTLLVLWKQSRIITKRWRDSLLLRSKVQLKNNPNEFLVKQFFSLNVSKGKLQTEVDSI